MAPNSRAVPKRPAGTLACWASRTCWVLRPDCAAVAAKVAASRSVSNLPGSRLFSVTPWRATLPRATPATKPVRPLRAPLDRPRMSIGALTALEVMFTTRPKPRAAMPSTVARMSSMGVSMFASSARSQASRSQSRKSPVGGPPALVTTMSKALPGPPGTDSAAARPAAVVMSAATLSTTGCWYFLPPALAAPAPAATNKAAACCSAAPSRALMTTFTPSCTSACAQPRPSPRLAPHTKAQRPAIPKSIVTLP